MKSKLLQFLLIAILTSSCGGGATENEKPKTPEELKMELVRQEKDEPLTYLSVKASVREDEVKTRGDELFHDAEYSQDGITIYGTITNTATIIKFKDVVLGITFYSNKTPITSQHFTINEFFVPNTENKFELKVYPPVEMNKFSIEIKDATAVD